jgi:WD40 repeat protein
MHAETLVQVWDTDTGEERFPEPLRSDEPLRTAAFSPDGKFLVTTSGNTALMWAVSGELLQSAIAAATTVCLRPEFRWQNLGESAAEAREKYQACERKHGREH